MKDVVAWALDWACRLTRHANGCWLLNDFAPTRRLWVWSLDLARDTSAPRKA